VYYVVATMLGILYWAAIGLGGAFVARRFPDDRLKALGIYSASIAGLVAVLWLFDWTRVLVAYPILGLSVGGVAVFWRGVAIIVVVAPVVWLAGFKAARGRQPSKHAWSLVGRWAFYTAVLSAFLFVLIYMPLESTTTYIGSDQPSTSSTIKPRLIEDMRLAEILSVGGAVVISLAVVAWSQLWRLRGPGQQEASPR